MISISFTYPRMKQFSEIGHTALIPRKYHFLEYSINSVIVVVVVFGIVVVVIVVVVTRHSSFLPGVSVLTEGVSTRLVMT